MKREHTPGYAIVLASLLPALMMKWEPLVDEVEKAFGVKTALLLKFALGVVGAVGTSLATWVAWLMESPRKNREEGDSDGTRGQRQEGGEGNGGHEETTRKKRSAEL